MKTLGILFIIVLSVSQIQDSIAQTFGIKGGLTLYNMYSKYDQGIDALENNPGIHLGATAESKLSKILSIETGFIFTTKGFKSKEIYPPSDHYVEINGTQNLYYFDIPITAKLSHNLNNVRIYEFFGNYIGLGLFGNGEYTTILDEKIETGKYDVKFGRKQHYKRLDFGLSLGAGIEIKSFLLEFSYNLGVKDFTEGGIGVMKNRVLNLSVGYKFNRNLKTSP